MTVIYCLNPECAQPKNETRSKLCQTCGASLILHKRYLAIKKIGKGGFGTTYLAIDLANKNSYCVIKQLLPVGDDPDTHRTALDLFEREAKTLAKINHPNIPKLLEYFEENQQFYLIQEFILGQDLEKEVQKQGVYPEATAKRFLREMLDIMKYIHGMKVIHRDIKPGNILRRKDNNGLVLIDFGAVKDEVNTKLMKSNPQTAFTKISVGTMGFAPPEQLAMRPLYSSDLYALAATCVFLMTGKAPKDLCDNITGELLWEKETNVSASFAKIINKMLELDVRKRYNTAEEIIQAMEIMPYEQKLAQGMLKKVTTPTPERQPTFPSSSDDVSTGSTSTNLADAIRKRKERRIQLAEGGAGNLPTPPLPTPNVPSISNLPKTSGSSLPKLSEEEVLQDYGRGNRNFSQKNLSQIDLSKVKLSGSSFSNSKLIGANFEGSNLYRANFYNANLTQANLREANLRKAELYKANLKSADLQGANLTEANLAQANLKDANLFGANLKGAKVDEEQLKQAKTNWTTIFPNGKRRWW